MNPLLRLQEFGQSPWYDYIRRGLITSGELKTMIDEDGLLGITSNPSIFEKAISGSGDYDKDLKNLAKDVTGIKDIYEGLVIPDIQGAADLMFSVYQKTKTRDGFVSIEVPPDLAHDTEGTIQEALRLYQKIGRENIFIKVPATSEGIPAIEALLGQGININVTLLFDVSMYEQVAWAYIAGLERYQKDQKDISKMSSVASFFISRIDSAIDGQLEDLLAREKDPQRREKINALAGQVGIANAKMAYKKFQEIFSTSRFDSLKKKGAKVQRLLWASTGTKNPRYPDTYYVDGLIGPETVNTMPAATFVAFKDHGTVSNRLGTDLDEAKKRIDSLSELGIRLQAVTQKLLDDGVGLFAESFHKLMEVISEKRKSLLGPKLNEQIYELGDMGPVVEARLRDLRESHFTQRIWSKDPTLWHEDPEHQNIIRNALGWLHVPEQQIHHLNRLKEIVSSIRSENFTHVLLLGMGGSSLCPEVCRLTFGKVKGFPELHVLDSTVPSQVRSFERRVNLEKTLFIVSSKSGTTTEPLVFFRYFFERARQVKRDQAGQSFIAITDPGSLLEKMAKENGFRYILPGVPDIGGRYSALSNFGMVPAALMGVNVEHLLYRAERMRHSCDRVVPPESNPGVRLGVVLGELAMKGRDKVTLVTSPSIRGLGIWLEQLIAESTGKEGKGIVPVDDETVGAPEVYGDDRLFVYIRYSKGFDEKQDSAVLKLQQAGHPVVRIELTDLVNLGEEFFLWELATAVSGTLFGINAFDQPNVQESKDNTKSILESFQTTGAFQDEKPFLSSEGVQLFSGGSYRQILEKGKSLEEALSIHLSQLQPGDYFALNAYIEQNDTHHAILQKIRHQIRDRKQVATTLGYGPRFLHSTGQLHKGGKNSGVFIQITSDDREDLAIPGETYTFGVLKAAQALGDFQSLNMRQRRAVRLHLGSEVVEGLKKLERLVDAILKRKV